MTVATYFAKGRSRLGYASLAFRRRDGATATIAEKRLLPQDRIEAFRRELFGIREEILRLMQRFRDEQ